MISDQIQTHILNGSSNEKLSIQLLRQSLHFVLKDVILVILSAPHRLHKVLSQEVSESNSVTGILKRSGNFYDH